MADLLLKNFTLLDTDKGRNLSGYQVLIRGDRIAAVEPGAIAAGGAEEVDLGGRTLMPGVIDAHVHIHSTVLPTAPIMLPSLITAKAAVRLKDMLLRGFTTVRDAAGADYGHKQAVEEGLFPGPRLFVCGRALSQTGGHGDARSKADQREICGCTHLVQGIGRVADGVDAVRQAVRDEIRLGADQIKIMAGGGVGSMSTLMHVHYSLDELKAVVDEAARCNTYVMAHAHVPLAIQRCLEAGVRCIEHGAFLDEPTAAAMARAGAYLSPNLICYDVIANKGLDYGYTPFSVGKAKEVFETGSRGIEIAKRAGVKIGFGSDLTRATEFQSDEFILRGRMEPAADVLRSATIVNAEIVRMAGEIGVVAPGAFADLLVVDGDPLADIALMASDGAHFSMIMKGGAIVKDRLSGRTQTETRP
jgi:imidazolonepropionase-like amidohydrolase